MTERHFDIETKLLALLELSKSTAKGTENEAALALETAIRLAAKHGISLTQLAEKRRKYAGEWFSEDVTVETVEYTDERYTSVSVREWGSFAEQHGWQRHRRTYDDFEGHIWMYRQPERMPALEVRIFERNWGDIEFEVVLNPDPIIGQLDSFTQMGFDCVALGVTFDDFKRWIANDANRLSFPRIHGQSPIV